MYVFEKKIKQLFLRFYAFLNTNTTDKYAYIHLQFYQNECLGKWNVIRGSAFKIMVARILLSY
jgi:hypothetical protein